MFIFFENFIVDNWNADCVAGLSGLSFLITLWIENSIWTAERVQRVFAIYNVVFHC